MKQALLMAAVVLLGGCWPFDFAARLGECADGGWACGEVADAGERTDAGEITDAGHLADAGELPDAGPWDDGGACANADVCERFDVPGVPPGWTVHEVAGVVSWEADAGLHGGALRLEPVMTGTDVRTTLSRTFIGDAGTVWVRAHFRFSTATANHDVYTFEAHSPTNRGRSIGTGVSDRPLAFADDGLNLFPQGPLIIGSGWRCYEFELDPSPRPSLKVFVDGVLQVTLDAGVFPNGGGRFEEFYLGAWDFTLSAPPTVWVDEVALGNRRLGCAP